MLQKERTEIKSELLRDFTHIQLHLLARYLDGPVQRKKLAFEREYIATATEGTLVMGRLRHGGSSQSSAIRERLDAYQKSLNPSPLEMSDAVYRRDVVQRLITEMRLFQPRSTEQMFGGLGTLHLAPSFDRLSRFFTPRELMDQPGFPYPRVGFDRVRERHEKRAQSAPQMERLGENLRNDLDKVGESFRNK